MQRINPWKISTIVLAAVATLLVAKSNLPVAHADVADEPIAMGVCHDQPNMAAAAASLKSARASLDKAEHNKGGWRVAAIEATNKAIAETDRGCAFADTH